LTGYRVWLILAVVALLSGWAGYRFNHSGSRPDVAADASLPQLLAAPLQGLDGRPHTLNEWHGRILVVNFWASWCPPCLEEIPSFSRAQQRLGDKDVRFVGVAIDDLKQVSEFANRTPVTYPLVIASATTLGITAGLGNASQGLPFTLVIARDGRLLFSKLGRLSDEELDARLQPLLAEKP
jgi:thiol-disulfide isomerase/thioredoxin